MRREWNEPGEIEIEVKPRNEWARPRLRTVPARDAEIGLVTPQVDGSFSLS